MTPPQPRQLPHRVPHVARLDQAARLGQRDDDGTVVGKMAKAQCGGGTAGDHGTAHFLGLGKWSLIHSRIISTMGLPLSTAKSFSWRWSAGSRSSVRRFIFFSFAIKKRLGTLNTTY